jgi:hypothetical protein
MGASGVGIDEREQAAFRPGIPYQSSEVSMRSLRAALHRLRAGGSTAGMSTAEYAVGTVAACGFGGVLYKVVTSPSVMGALNGLIHRALNVAF